MNNNPLEIIIEFLNSETPQLRRNAMTALASLHDSEAVKYMVQTALTDKDESVRARAEDELANLDEQSLTMLSKDFITRLGDKSESLPAYALLGRLRSRGLQLKLESLNWLRTLYLEFSLFKYVYPNRGWKFYLRSSMPAAKAGLMAAVIYFIFFTLLHYRINWFLPQMHSFSSLDTNVSFTDLIVGSPIAMALLIPLATFRAMALDLYTDRVKGALIESLWAGLAGLLLGATVSSGFAIAVLLTMVAVRMGCISAHGVEFDYVPKHFAQALAGTLAGTLVLLAFAVLNFDKSTDVKFDYYESTNYLVAFIPAAANSYATMDIAHVNALSRNTLLPRLIAYGLPILFAIFIGVAYFPESSCIVTEKTIQASAAFTDPVEVDISRAPYCRSLVVGAEQQAVITVPVEEVTHYGIRILKGSEYDVSTVDLPVELKADPSINSKVDSNSKNKITVSTPGQYMLIFSRKDSGLLHKQINSKNALLILFDHYSNLLRHGKNAIQSVKMNIVFTNISKK